MDSRKRRPSASLVISFIALAVAIGGSAYAASKITSGDIARNAVTARKIKNGAVKGNKIPNGALSTAKFKNGSVTGPKLAAGAVDASKIVAGAITGAQVANDSLSDKQMSDYEVIGNSPVRVVATEAASLDAARQAAPENVLFTKGQITIYAKCFRDTTAGHTQGDIIVRTSADGALMQGEDSFPIGSGNLLNTNTPENNRVLSVGETENPDAGDIRDDQGVVIAPDGTTLSTVTVIATKQGTLAGGNGAYGDGNVCLFGGGILG